MSKIDTKETDGMASQPPVAPADADSRQILERAEIAHLIQQERATRDAALWDEMARYYHPDSFVDVAWFKGSGQAFVDATKKNWRTDAINFHEMGTAIVTVNNDRAIAETACTLHGFYTYEGVPVTSTGFVRLFWRAQRLEGRWLIAGLRSAYLRDLLQPCNPSQSLVLDEVELSTYRPSYRYLTATLKYLGREPKDDLPGYDRPETVATLLENERHWLQQGSSVPAIA